MFCINCGKSISQDGKICAHCGKPISSNSKSVESSPIEWEYTYYRATWDQGGKFPLTFGKTEYQVRLDNWGSDQSWILPEIQKFLDKGWTPVTEIGPGGYHFMTLEDYAGGVKISSLSVNQFLVELRRPAVPLSDYENQLLGRWEEVGNFNQGLLNKLENLFVYQNTRRKKWQYIFYKNRKFIRISADGSKQEGVFLLSDGNEITLEFRLPKPEFLIATLQDGRLTCKGKGYQTMRFERVK